MQNAARLTYGYPIRGNKMQNDNKKGRNTEKIVGISVFSALAFVVALVCNVIPPVAGFLSLDIKDSLIAIAAFSYGSVSAVIISLIAAVLELLTFSTTGWYGFVMNFVSSSAFSLTASFIYSKFRSINGAVVGIYSAVAVTTGTMLLMNVLVTPWYLVYIGVPEAAAHGQVAELLPKVLLPFNFAKTLLNGATLMMIYKPVTLAMSRIGIGAKKKSVTKWGRKTVFIMTVGGVSLLAAMAILLLLWL